MHTLLIINVNKKQLLDMDIGTMHREYMVCPCPRTYSENEFFFKIINANVGATIHNIHVIWPPNVHVSLKLLTSLAGSYYEEKFKAI